MISTHELSGHDVTRCLVFYFAQQDSRPSAAKCLRASNGTRVQMLSIILSCAVANLHSGFTLHTQDSLFKYRGSGVVSVGC